MTINDVCMVLVPFDPKEAIALKEAAALAGKTPNTVRNWCEAYGLGRRIGGTWSVSRVALAMFLDGDDDALSLYLNGDRSSEPVMRYFRRCRL
jgi:hypothetical protein